MATIFLQILMTTIKLNELFIGFLCSPNPYLINNFDDEFYKKMPRDYVYIWVKSQVPKGSLDTIAGELIWQNGYELGNEKYYKMNFKRIKADDREIGIGDTLLIQKYPSLCEWLVISEKVEIIGFILGITSDQIISSNTDSSGDGDNKYYINIYAYGKIKNWMIEEYQNAFFNIYKLTVIARLGPLLPSYHQNAFQFNIKSSEIINFCFNQYCHKLLPEFLKGHSFYENLTPDAFEPRYLEILKFPMVIDSLNYMGVLFRNRTNIYDTKWDQYVMICDFIIYQEDNTIFYDRLLNDNYIYAEVYDFNQDGNTDVVLIEKEWNWTFSIIQFKRGNVFIKRYVLTSRC
ncbi:MAG: hypothetical protein ABIL70_01700 [candidate division WOR-3 bacterium]